MKIVIIIIKINIKNKIFYKRKVQNHIIANNFLVIRFINKQAKRKIITLIIVIIDNVHNKLMIVKTYINLKIIRLNNSRSNNKYLICKKNKWS